MASKKTTGGDFRMPDPPSDLIEIHPFPKRMQLKCNDEIIADSTRSLLLWERGIPPIHYFPQDDVNMDFLIDTNCVVFNRHKGEARYWDVKVRDRREEKAAWVYREPRPPVAMIKDYMAFFEGRLAGKGDDIIPPWSVRRW